MAWILPWPPVGGICEAFVLCLPQEHVQIIMLPASQRRPAHTSVYPLAVSSKPKPILYFKISSHLYSATHYSLLRTASTLVEPRFGERTHHLYLPSPAYDSSNPSPARSPTLSKPRYPSYALSI